MGLTDEERKGKTNVVKDLMEYARLRCLIEPDTVLEFIWKVIFEMYRTGKIELLPQETDFEETLGTRLDLDHVRMRSKKSLPANM